MATYTNVTDASFGATDIPNVKSVELTQTTEFLESQSDGARGPTKVGEKFTRYTATITAEANGLGTVLAKTGISNSGSFVFKESLDATPATVVTRTVTNMVLKEGGVKTSQTDPNEYTFSLESKGIDSALSLT